MKTITAGAENLQSPEPGTYVETYEVKNYVSSETNDLAVVYTTKNMHFNKKTQAICLPEKASEDLNDITGDYVIFQQKGRDSRIVNNNQCNSWSWLNLTRSEVCVDLEYQPYQFYPKDSGAPLIMEGRNFFEVIGILADVKEDNGINPGVFAYEVHPDNFEFIYGKKSKKS